MILLDRCQKYRYIFTTFTETETIFNSADWVVAFGYCVTWKLLRIIYGEAKSLDADLRPGLQGRTDLRDLQALYSLWYSRYLPAMNELFIAHGLRPWPAEILIFYCQFSISYPRRGSPSHIRGFITWLCWAILPRPSERYSSDCNPEIIIHTTRHLNTKFHLYMLNKKQKKYISQWAHFRVI